MKTNIPNILTWIRIAAIPVVVWCFLSDLEFARPMAGIVFGLAAITDLLDGYIARKLNQISRFGEFLDPVADKLLVAAAILMLVGFERLTGLQVLAALVILCRWPLLTIQSPQLA